MSQGDGWMDAWVCMSKSVILSSKAAGMQWWYGQLFTPKHSKLNGYPGFPWPHNIRSLRWYKEFIWPTSTLISKLPGSSKWRSIWSLIIIFTILSDGFISRSKLLGCPVLLYNHILFCSPGVPCSPSSSSLLTDRQTAEQNLPFDVQT